MFDNIWLVIVGLSAIILTVMYSVSYVVVFVFDVYGESDLALLIIISQQSEFCL